MTHGSLNHGVSQNASRARITTHEEVGIAVFARSCLLGCGVAELCVRVLN